jgi:hypothetical protein
MADDTDIGTLLARISLDVSELKTGLMQGKEEMSSFASQSKAEAEEVATGFKGAMLQVQASVKEGFAQVKSIAAEGVAGIQSSIVGMGSIIAGALGLSLLKQSADEVVNWAKDINKASQLLGATTEEASKWKYALGELSAENLGAEYSLQQLESAFQRFLMRAMNSPQKLQELGISLQSLNDPTKSFTDKWFELADAIQKIDDPTKQAALAVEMFGRNGMTLLPLLRMTREQFTEWGNDASKMGLVLDEQTKGTLQRYTIAVHDLEEAWLAVKLKTLPIVNEWVLGIEKDFSNLIVTLKADAGIIKEIFAGIGAAASRAAHLDLSGSGQALINIPLKAAEIANKANAEIDKNNADYNKKLNAPPVGGTQKTGGAAGFDIGDKLGGGGKGGGKAAPEEDIFGEQLRLADQKRQAEIQAAQESLDLLKATDDAKKAELQKQMSEGTIDAQGYYNKLKDIAQGEVSAELKLIDQKKAAQQAAYKDAQTNINRSDASPEMKAIQLLEEAIKNTMAMKQLDEEAARAKLEGEKKVTDELKKQAEIKAQYAEKTDELNRETAVLTGQITQQDAELAKLTIEWQKAKQEAMKAGGASDAYLAALQNNLNAKKADALWGGMAGDISQGIGSILDSLMSPDKSTGRRGKGQQDGGIGQMMEQETNKIFKNLFDQALKPGLDSLKTMLVNGFKDLFGDAGGALSSAIMGAIGLIGMMLTSSSQSSWDSSGASSNITSSQAVRGVIAGPESVAIADVGAQLSDSLIPTNEILENILNVLQASKTGSTGGNGNPLTVTLDFSTLPQAVQQWLQQYFQSYLMKGAPA